jgi:cellulose synthase/poly-beta-1,6-N-acetylglucosamine synthase-like glycosyltransferase
MSSAIPGSRLHGLPPEASAATSATLTQRIAGAAVLSWVGLAVIEDAPARWGLAVALGLLVLSVSLLRIAATIASCMPDEDDPPLPEADLPAYSLLVPLYREAEVVPQLLAALARLDYPADRLQVLLLVEAEDQATLGALRSCKLPCGWSTVVVPPGAPLTKPRALTFALPLAVGTLLTVYDAEDLPEVDQLRRAAARFAARPDLVCLQARLAIDNPEAGWLAALFAVEYAVLFDVVNPGLARLGLPLLLGGTSNHFRTADLRRVDGWDPWNVTEDADLGLRLARHGMKVGVIASTTQEEAPARLQAWLRQRRRWMKGWMRLWLSV